ncbi:hypothetical protein GCM10011588_41080 [Nocardia jinanensis]|uniref:Uncharacterized protein n=1 Tax=Nocardia jinanensis TaxID=382504 RepID=A0A917RRA1_9NOCA|nr:hypothetical protein GCM10011588_41080 [Nocardia jinanensis]
MSSSVYWRRLRRRWRGPINPGSSLLRSVAALLRYVAPEPGRAPPLRWTNRRREKDEKNIRIRTFTLMQPACVEEADNGPLRDLVRMRTRSSNADATRMRRVLRDTSKG